MWSDLDPSSPASFVHPSSASNWSKEKSIGRCLKGRSGPVHRTMPTTSPTERPQLISPCTIRHVSSSGLQSPDRSTEFPDP